MLWFYGYLFLCGVLLTYSPTLGTIGMLGALVVVYVSCAVSFWRIGTNIITFCYGVGMLVYHVSAACWHRWRS